MSTLSKETEAFIASQLESGRFSSREQALEAGVSMLKKREDLATRLAESRRQLDNGEFTDYTEAELTSRFEDLKTRAADAGE